MSAEISIVIPCYNVLDVVDEAIDSALIQEHVLEVICVDNGSRDGTIKRLEQRANKGEIRLMHQDVKGAPAARNMGWRAAKGTYIQFLDADDLLLEGKLAVQWPQVQARTNAAFLASITEKCVLGKEDECKLWPVHENPWKGLLSNSLGNTVANLFQRKALEAVGGWDESRKSSQEYDLMFRLMKWREDVIIENSHPLTRIRAREQGSISSQSTRDNQHRYLALMSQIMAYLKEEKPKVYRDLSSELFDDFFLRLRLNTIDGYPHSALFFNQIFKKGYRPVNHRYNTPWFVFLFNIFGFTVADRVQRILLRIRS